MADRDITPTELREKGEDVQLIDVRENYEWDAGRMPGARHIELGQVAAQAQTIDREKPVVFYCRVGSRSAMAADAFRQAGYDAYSLGGGLLAWEREGGALEPEDGTVAAH
jgi:rhodanese-related sulfurtransferase